MIEDLFAYNKPALEIPEVIDLLNRCKRVEAINSQLFQSIEQLKNVAETLIVIAFSDRKLRDHWRIKFNISKLETFDE
jgi:hypothetical protein